MLDRGLDNPKFAAAPLGPGGGEEDMPHVGFAVALTHVKVVGHVIEFDEITVVGCPHDVIEASTCNR